MYLGCKVKIPKDGGNITVKTINGTSYVYIERGRTYSKEKKYSIPMLSGKLNDASSCRLFRAAFGFL